MMLHHVALVRNDVSEEQSILCSVRQLLVTANVAPSSLIVTLKIEALHSSELWFLQEPHGITSQKTAFFVNYCVHNSLPLVPLQSVHTTSIRSHLILCIHLHPVFLHRHLPRLEHNTWFSLIAYHFTPL
jgi:hypothetical protein